LNISRETSAALVSFGVPRETQTRLEAFVRLLCAWTIKINLVGSADAATIWTRHVVDSLQLLPLIPSGTERATDLGSGAGFPGLILSAASGIPFDLIEADRRKAAFLGEAARLLHAPAVVHPTRIEACSLAPASLVTSRALAPLTTLLPLAAPLLAADGVALFPKGAKVDAEIRQAAVDWTMTIERFTSITDPGGVILRVSEVARA
jgi:16S rRNA (guanine(527)-N(7))-methyltransferase RsmG